MKKELLEQILIELVEIRRLLENKPSRPKSTWTDEERETVLRNMHLSNHEIAKMLPGRSLAGIQSIKNNSNRWTPEEEAILAEYAKLNTLEISDELKQALPKRTIGALRARLKNNYGIVNKPFVKTYPRDRHL